MKILAFQGLRYTDRAGDPAHLAAPPFDQIDDALRDRLQRREAHQFAHLTRPIPGPEGDSHRHAASLHGGWLADGIIARDRAPSLYPYAIEGSEGSVRRGLCCLVSVAPDRRDDLRPHEQTVAKPLADRLALLRAMRVDLEPVLLLAEDEDGAFEGLLEEELRRSPEALVRHLDENRQEHHVLYRLDDAGRIRRYQELLADRFAAIADGHHRTKVAQLYAEETGAVDGTAAAAKLCVLTSLASRELRIDPIHRAIGVPLDTEALLALPHHRSAFEGSDGAAFAAAVAEAPQPAVGVRLDGGKAEIWRLDPEQVPADFDGDRNLAVSLLQHHLLKAAGLGPETATDGSILYRSDPAALWQQVEGGEAEAGFWLPPMDPADFAAATARGELMPPKSTRFLPKLVSGLVWSGHDGKVL